VALAATSSSPPPTPGRAQPWHGVLLCGGLGQPPREHPLFETLTITTRLGWLGFCQHAPGVALQTALTRDSILKLVNGAAPICLGPGLVVV